MRNQENYAGKLVNLYAGFLRRLLELFVSFFFQLYFIQHLLEKIRFYDQFWINPDHNGKVAFRRYIHRAGNPAATACGKRKRKRDQQKQFILQF